MRIHKNLLASRNQNRSTVVAQRGMACAEQPLAAMAAIDMLKAGGTAIDAAVAANAVLAVTEPMMCGMGGDLFAIVWSEKDGKLFGLNASGRAPYDWNLDAAKKLGLTDAIPPFTPLAWSVPGCVSGWGALLGRFGKLGFSRVLEPAIHYAREGFPVAPIASRDWGFEPKEYPTLARTFAPEGRAPEFGEIFKNPDMARSLEAVAGGGADAYYRGEVAERIVKYSQANGGRFSMRDFAEHTPTWVEPVSTNYRGFDVWEIPPNGQGIAALQMLNILEQFDVGALEPNSAEHLHLFIEAKKLAFEDRAVYYADPEFADVPVKWLISKEYGRERAKLVDPKRAAWQVAPGRLRGGSETTYLTAADGEGNMISLIQSIYHGWGSHIVPGGVGFCLQSRGCSFSLDPNARNRLEPHKRPFHTIIPAFVTRGPLPDGRGTALKDAGSLPGGRGTALEKMRPTLAFGVMGGDFQPQGHVQVLMNLIDFGFSPQQAGEQPRIEHYESSTPQGVSANGVGAVGFERGIGNDAKARLVEMGHSIRKDAGAFGGFQGIWREENPRRYFGGSDPRKDGGALGF